MSTLDVRLFGRFKAQSMGLVVNGLEAAKVQELLCYLLLHRDHIHPREFLASLLWENTSTSRSKTYLRKTLWQLQTAIRFPIQIMDDRILVVTQDTVLLHSNPCIWIDSAEFEHIYEQVRGLPGQRLDSSQVEILKTAVQLYSGNLLEDWYQEWCIYERERFEYMYISMLDKLMDHCGAQKDYEAGLGYGIQILYHDYAHERTHQRMMLFYFLSGDRTSAIRQYRRCVAALDKELGVKPSKSTMALYDQICTDQVTELPLEASTDSQREPLSEHMVLDRLSHLCVILSDVDRQIHQDVELLNSCLNRQR